MASSLLAGRSRLGSLSRPVLSTLSSPSPSSRPASTSASTGTSASASTASRAPTAPNRAIYLATPTKERLRKAREAAQLNRASPSGRYPPTQPPSHKPGTLERSQLLRRYISLVRSSPLLLLFQHGNLTAAEWVAVRRELAAALAAADERVATAAAGTAVTPIAPHVRISVVKTGLLAQALRLVDYYNPAAFHAAATAASAGQEAAVESELLTHYLSAHAHAAIADAPEHPLHPLMGGPVAAVGLPALSPAHVEAVLRILSPSAPALAAPRRRERPSLYEPAAQAGLHKIFLLGGRVWEWRGEAAFEKTRPRVVDDGEVRWMAGLGSVEAQRAQAVALLGQPAAGLAAALAAPSTALWAALESRKQGLEEEANPGPKPEEGA